MYAEDIVRQIAPAIGRRRIERGLRWLRSGQPLPAKQQFLIAHGFLPDEILPKNVLSYLWREARSPSIVSFMREIAA